MTTRFLSEIPVADDVISYWEAEPYGPLPAGTLGEIYDAYSIDDYSISYLNINYSATDSINVSLAISNLFDKQPPYFKDLFGFVDPQINTPQNTYDVIGRYYTVGFKINL
jgi:outer membrane receptor for ferrienterochelin and colicin